MVYSTGEIAISSKNYFITFIIFILVKETELQTYTINSKKMQSEKVARNIPKAEDD